MKGRSGERARPRWSRTSSSGTSVAQVVVGQELDRVQLVRCPEPVEEVQERHARSQGGGLRDQRQVVGLLHGCRCEQGEPRLAGRHHVRVVAEDRQALRRERPGGDVQHRRRQLAGDLVHVRDHQQQALRRGERRGERATLKRAVQRAGGSALALHLDHRGHAAPDVGATLARPLVGQLGHRRGRRDREDAADLVQAVGDADSRLVSVDDRTHLSHARRACRWRAPGTARSRPRSRYSGRSRTGSGARGRA